MQFFLANLYSERLTGALAPVTEDTTASVPSGASVASVDNVRTAEAALVGSR